MAGREDEEDVSIQAPALLELHGRVERPALVEGVQSVLDEERLEGDAHRHDEGDVESRVPLHSRAALCHTRWPRQ